MKFWLSVGQTYKSLCGPCPVCIFRHHHNLPFPRPCRRSGPFLTRLLVQHITLSRKVSLQPESNFFCYMLSECCVDVPQLIISVIMPLFLIHSLMAGEEGFALEPSALGVSRELRGQLRGLEFVFRQSWELGHMTYVDLGLWFLVSEIGTWQHPRPCYEKDVTVWRFLGTFVIIKDC